MNKLNLYFGISLFIIFIITGYYMKEYFKPEHINDVEQRLQIRSNHIYILFIALLNIAVSVCQFEKSKKLFYYLDFSFRTLIIISGIISILAFCFEHTGELKNRTFTLITVILSLASIGLLLLTEIMSHKNKNKKLNR